MKEVGGGAMCIDYTMYPGMCKIIKLILDSCTLNLF